MANENNDISDIVKKCKILLLDIEGTTTSISFVKDKLFPYAEEHVKVYLENQWEEEDVKETVIALKKLAHDDQEKNVEGVVTIPGEEASKEDQIEGLVKNVKWQMSSDRKAGPLKHLQGLIWKQGYDKGDIKGHIYDDVSPALEQWHTTEGQKIYIYSSGSVQAQKLLFGQSSAGDLLPLIDGHFDTAIGSKQEANSYTAIAEKIGCKTEDILFLTDIVKEAEAARSTGMHVALVSREGNAPLSAEATMTYPLVHSFVQLTNTNKRKPEDTQDEQPAKIPKTNVDDHVKTTEISQKPTVEECNTSLPKPEESEKMEIEEVIDTKVDEKLAPEELSVEKVVIEEIITKEETLVPDSVNPTPIITEVDTETNSKPELMEVELPVTTEVNEEAQEKVNDKDKQKVPSSLENPISIVTVIEEVLDKNQAVSEIVEAIEDMNPVIEEPESVEDIEELKNVGDVLEKECDEILSKVQNVTNLDNIPLKPLLNTIHEETMETENLDTNDIVDRILDTEMEMESKIVQDTLGTKEINEGKEINMGQGKPKMDVTDKINEIPEDSSFKQITVQKNLDNKKLIKMETVECQTETKTETVGFQVNMDENKCDMQDGKDEARDSKLGMDKAENIKELKSDKQINPEKEIKVSKKEESIQKTENNTCPTVVDDKKVEEKEAQQSQMKPNDNKDLGESKEKSEIHSSDNNELTIPVENLTGIAVVATKEVNLNDIKSDNDVKDMKMNGNSTNGETDALALNGDASKDDELSSRLSVENTQEVVNGSNGEPTKEQGQGDNKIETDVTEIKVKTVSAEEPPNEPIEQPTEA